MLKDPIGFKKAMLDAKHEFEVDMERQSWPPSAAGPGSDRRIGAARRQPDDDHAAPGRPAAGTGRARGRSRRSRAT